KKSKHPSSAIRAAASPIPTTGATASVPPTNVPAAPTSGTAPTPKNLPPITASNPTNSAPMNLSASANSSAPNPTSPQMFAASQPRNLLVGLNTAIRPKAAPRSPNSARNPARPNLTTSNTGVSATNPGAAAAISPPKNMPSN